MGLEFCHLLIIFPLNPQVVYHMSAIMSFNDHISLDSSGRLSWFTDHLRPSIMVYG